jgi:hypothetical protein
MSKDYNKIEVKDNMRVQKDNNEEVEAKEKVQIEKIVSVQPKKVKKSLIGRLVSGVVGPDGLPGIGSYVNEEIIKPAIKNIIVDAVTSGINMVMYGEKGGANRGGYRPNVGSRNSLQPRTNYRAASEHTERPIARPARGGVDEYSFELRDEAAQVLVSLTEYADMYDVVSVADYYDTIGIKPKFTDNNVGWTIDSITRATIMPIRGGYIIKFPPTEVI